MSPPIFLTSLRLCPRLCTGSQNPADAYIVEMFVVNFGRWGRHDSENCDESGVKETVRHFLLECPVKVDLQDDVLWKQLDFRPAPITLDGCFNVIYTSGWSCLEDGSKAALERSEIITKTV